MHHINGYIGPIDELKRLTKDFKHARIVTLDVKTYGFLPYTDELSREMGKKWYRIGTQAKAIAHVETDYFGGGGEQSAAYWENGKKVFKGKGSGSPIDKALKLLGVVCSEGNDEFDTLGLGHHRTNEDWAEVGVSQGEPCCNCCGVPARVYNQKGHDKECTFWEEEMYRLAKEWVCKYDPGTDLGDWRDRYDLAVEFLLDQTTHLKNTIKELRDAKPNA